MMRNNHKYLFKDALFCVILSAFFLWIVSFLLINISILNPFTNAFKDFSFLDIYYSEEMEAKNPSKDIIIINIEKRDRFELYQLINHIKQFKPKVIGLDIIFKDRKDPFVDSLLVSAVADKNIILSKAYVEGNWVYNHSLFKSEFNQVGYTNINFDRTNNVIRTFQGEKIIMDTTHYALSTQILKKRNL